jgi:hypothetical protein
MEEVVLEDPGEDGKFPECPVCYDALNRNSAAAYVHSIVTHPQAVETLFSDSATELAFSQVVFPEFRLIF